MCACRCMLMEISLHAHGDHRMDMILIIHLALAEQLDGQSQYLEDCFFSRSFQKSLGCVYFIAPSLSSSLY